MSLHPHREARLIGLKALFQMEVGGQTLERALENVIHEELEPGARDYGERLVRGVQAHLPALDRLIEEQARNWRLERIARVELTLLRIGVYELVHCAERVPAPVILNEAIELAQEYGDERSGAFVNGLLDGIRRRLEGLS